MFVTVSSGLKIGKSYIIRMINKFVRFSRSMDKFTSTLCLAVSFWLEMLSTKRPDHDALGEDSLSGQDTDNQSNCLNLSIKRLNPATLFIIPHHRLCRPPKSRVDDFHHSKTMDQKGLKNLRLKRDK